MFKKDDFDKDYLDFDSTFHIRPINSVIFAPNGTGKTSIYKVIREKGVTEGTSFAIDYESMLANFVKRKKKIIFGPNILELDKNEKETKEIAGSIDVAKVFKTLDITTKASANNIESGIGDIFKDDLKIMSLYTEENKEVLLPFKEFSKEIINNFNEFKEIAKLRDEINLLGNSKLQSILKEMNKLLSDEDTVCPICDKNSEVPISILIENKTSDVQNIESKLVEQISGNNPNMTYEAKVLKLNEITECFENNNINSADIISFALYTTLDDKKTDLIGKKNKLNELGIEKASIQEKLKRFFDFVTTDEHYLNQLSEIFKIDKSSIATDNESFTITINLERDLNTYSTGELNVALFVTSLYEFIQSDRQWLIMDDPISSFDLPNQYKIVFEVMSMLLESTNPKRNAILLTHNLDVINIVRSESKSGFKHFCIESTNIKQNVNEKKILRLSEIAMNDSISFKELLSRLSIHEYDDYSYLKAIETREELPKGSEDRASLNSIFHFHGCVSKTSYEGKELSNEYLYNKIDMIEKFGYLHNTRTNRGKNNHVFYIDSAEKIIYLSALRVWVERQLFLRIDNPSTTREFLDKYTLGEKIELVLDDSSNQDNKALKKALLSKKTMLNQNNHQFSQTSPFNYALNLSLSDIENEILEIKNLFNRN